MLSSSGDLPWGCGFDVVRLSGYLSFWSVRAAKRLRLALHDGSTVTGGAAPARRPCALRHPTVERSQKPPVERHCDENERGAKDGCPQPRQSEVEGVLAWGLESHEARQQDQREAPDRVHDEQPPDAVGDPVATEQRCQAQRGHALEEEREVVQRKRR